MSERNGKDYIYLVWKDDKTRKNFKVGQLSKNGCFEFKYDFEVKDAIEKGFKPLISFEDINKVFTSTILFPAFSSRLPDRKRKNINEILVKYDMVEYDDYTLLKRSGGRLPIDSLEFIDPILDVSDGKAIERYFFMAGPRHYIGCNGEECEKSMIIEKNDKLKLQPEPSNEFDPTAIKVLSETDDLLGYIPRYHSDRVCMLLNKGYKYDCTVSEVNKDNDCDNCIKIKLVLNKLDAES